MKELDEYIPLQHIFYFIQSWWWNAAILSWQVMNIK